MSGDYSRWSVRPAAALRRRAHAAGPRPARRRLERVGGRRSLRRVQAGTLDTLGARPSCPRETPDGFQIAAAGGALTIGPGRMYVDGLLAENHGEPPAGRGTRASPSCAGTAPLAYDGAALPPRPARRCPTAPDRTSSTSRSGSARSPPSRTRAWSSRRSASTPRRGSRPSGRSRCSPTSATGVTCATPLDDDPGLRRRRAARPPARLTTGDRRRRRSSPTPARSRRAAATRASRTSSTGSRSTTPAARRRRPRDVQVVARQRHGRHAGHRDPRRSTGSWSRASAATTCSRFRDGDWVEITDDWRELAGLPGEMRRIQAGGGVDDDDAARSCSTEPLPAGRVPDRRARGGPTPARNTRVRRWDQHGSVVERERRPSSSTSTPPPRRGRSRSPPAPTKILLEHGIVVTFGLDAGGGEFRTGDHWVFAARTADASVEELDARAAARHPRPLRQARRSSPSPTPRPTAALRGRREARRRRAATARSACRRSRTRAAR